MADLPLKLSEPWSFKRGVGKYPVYFLILTERGSKTCKEDQVASKRGQIFLNGIHVRTMTVSLRQKNLLFFSEFSDNTFTI